MGHNVSYLLDTHVLLWWLADDPKLPIHHRELLEDGDATVYVSSITVAEISIKSSLGKLTVPDGITTAVQDSGFQLLDFTTAHAEQLRALPWHHRDPFDRMLIAQAQVDGLTFLSVDERVRQYDVSLSPVRR